MNRSSSSAQRRSRWFQTIFWFPCAVVLLLFLVVGPFLWIELSAASQLKHALHQAKLNGIPYNNGTAQEKYQNQTRKEGSNVWSEILWLAGSRAIRDQMDLLNRTSDGTALDPEGLEADAPQDVAPQDYDQRLRQFIQDAKPLLELIEKECQSPGPVQLPMTFAGIGTTLENVVDANNVCRLVAFQFENAWNDFDVEKSMRALQTYSLCLKLFDWRIGSTASMYFQIPNQHRLYTQIGRSLEENRWSQADLMQLESMFAPIDLASAWRDMIDMDRCMSQEVGNDNYATAEEKLAMEFVYRPTHRLQDWQLGESIRNMGELGFEEQLKRVKVGRGGHAPGFSFISHWKMASIEYAKLESHRRLVKTALQLRKYRIANGTWPEDLAELETKTTDESVPRRSCSGEPFEFKPSDDVQNARLSSAFDDSSFRDIKSFQEQIASRNLRFSIELRP